MEMQKYMFIIIIIIVFRTFKDQYKNATILPLKWK